MHAHFAGVNRQTNSGNITIAFLYLPPKKVWAKKDFQYILNSLDSKFSAGGDFNAKHAYRKVRQPLKSSPGHKQTNILFVQHPAHTFSFSLL